MWGAGLGPPARRIRTTHLNGSSAFEHPFATCAPLASFLATLRGLARFPRLTIATAVVKRERPIRITALFVIYLVACRANDASVLTATYEPRSGTFQSIEIEAVGKKAPEHEIATDSEITVTLTSEEQETSVLRLRGRGFEVFVIEGDRRLDAPAMAEFLRRAGAYDESRGSLTEVDELVRIVEAIALLPTGGAPTSEALVLVPSSSE